MRSDQHRRLDGLQREIDLRVRFSCFRAPANLRAGSGWLCGLRDQRGMDGARRVAARRDLLRCRSFPEQSMAASVVVRDWSRGRFNCVSWVTPKSDRGTDDLLANGVARGVTTFFATYYYHGNAGAFLNLVWPLTAGLAIRAFTTRSHPGMRAVWISAFILTVAGCWLIPRAWPS